MRTNNNTKLCFCSIDHTYKVYIGGAQKRPDGNYTRPVLGPNGKVIGQVADGNRKDIRDAVEAAHKAAPGYIIFDVKVEIILGAFTERFLQLEQCPCNFILHMQSAGICFLNLHLKEIYTLSKV